MRSAVRPAAFVLVQPAPGELVGVTRPDGGWGLPGGELDPGEAAGAAAVRELFEETGLVPERIALVFQGVRHGRPITIWWASGRLWGRLRSSDEGVAAIVRTATLANGRYGRTIRRALANVKAGATVSAGP